MENQSTFIELIWQHLQQLEDDTLWQERLCWKITPQGGCTSRLSCFKGDLMVYNAEFDFNLSHGVTVWFDHGILVIESEN